MDRMTLVPSDMICFALYSTTHAMQQAYRPLLDALGITYPQYLVLRVLWAEKVPMIVSGIGGMLYLDSSTVTPLLKRLEAAGLVMRNRDPHDERKVHVTLTNAGREMEARAAHVSACIFQQTGLDAGALERLHTEVSELGEKLRACAKPDLRPSTRGVPIWKTRI